MSILKQLGKLGLLVGMLGMFAYAYAEPVNINKADAATLASSISGIGPSKAKAIVQYRRQHGPFKSVQELAKVKGIGKKFILKHKAELLLTDAKR
jgi:competence protein ComEA